MEKLSLIDANRPEKLKESINELIDKGGIGVDKYSLGLGNVNNTSDIDKPISIAQQHALEQKLDKSEAKNFCQKIFLSVDPTTYELSVNLMNSNNEVLSNGIVDLPLESMVVGGSYNNNVLSLTLKNGQVIDIDISNIVRGLVPDSRTINGKPLTNNIVLTAEDIGFESSEINMTEIESKLLEKANMSDLPTMTIVTEVL